MASVMGIGGGLVGPKTENVGFSLVFKGFLKGPLIGRRFGPAKMGSIWVASGLKK